MMIAAAIALVVGASGSRAQGERAVTDQAVRDFAQNFLQLQHDDGSFDVSSRVQAHLKAQIGMALAAQALHEPLYAAAAARDHAWVATYYLESDGGLSWDGTSDPFFFECHQHWFLIASHLIGASLGTESEEVARRRAVWAFLRRTNQAGQDFYLHNQAHYGPFFAYRCVDRDGRFMTQFPFKGSYEVGVALWSLAILKDAGEDEPVSVGDSLAIAAYLDYSVRQAILPPQELGFYQPGQQRWIRSILWHNPGWWGYEAPDWKYALHMEEGALEYEYRTGQDELESAIRGELQQLLSRVRPDGQILDFPDVFGTPVYEFGEALSVLGLATLTFCQRDPQLAQDCMLAGQRVADYALHTFWPQSSEEGAMLLGGLSRLLEAQDALNALADEAGEEPSGHAAGADQAVLRIAPTLTTGRVGVHWSLPVAAPATLSVFDVSGRQLTSVALSGAARSGDLAWDLRDRKGVSLPNGHYIMVIDTKFGRMTNGFVVAR
jgi:hypothetical protein